MNNLFLLGIVESLFFFLILLLKKKKSNSDIILSVWLIIFALHFIFPYFIYKDFPRYVHLSGMDSGIMVLHSILLYIYTKSLLSRNKKFCNKIGVHISVFIISNLIIIPYIIIDEELKVEFYNNTLDLPLKVWIPSVIISFLFLFYLFTTIWFLIKHKNQLKNEFSYLEKLDLNWVKYLTIGLLVFYIALTLVGSVLYALNISIYNIDYYIYALLVVFIFGIGFFGIKQQNVFSNLNIYDNNLKNLNNKKHSVAQNIISKEEEKFSRNLQEFMSSEKAYLNNDLSLYDLANMLNVKPHYLSYILNNVLKTNFYEFVNFFRVEEMKSQLNKHYKEFTILGIALESGFNSKATANRIFKHYTGKTPSQYITTIKN